MNVGDILTDESDQVALPVGAEVVSSNTIWYRNVEGWWCPESGWTPCGGLPHPTLRSLPENSPQESLAQYLQRFRTTALGQACRAGAGYLQQTNEVLQKLNLSFNPSLGMPIDPWDRISMRDLPDGTLLIQGEPEHWRSFRVAKVAGDSMEQILGGYGGEGLMTVHRGIDSDWWLTSVGDESDQQAIREFQARAWSNGYEAKNRHGWCGDFEFMMRRVGVTREIIMARNFDPENLTVGQVLTVDQIARLPVNSIVRFNQGGRRVNWYRRTPDSDNPAGTVGIWGPANGNWASAGRVEFVCLPGGQPLVPVASREELQEAPIGTVIGEPGSIIKWRKTDTDIWTASSNGMTVRSIQFSLGRLRFEQVPGVWVENEEAENNESSEDELEAVDF